MKQTQQNLLGLWQRFLFEMIFALKSDPWQHRSPYQQTKYQQTLKLLPSSLFGKHWNLAVLKAT